MKNLKLLTITAVFLFVSLCGFGQATSKIHFFNPSGRIIIEKFPDNYLKLKGYTLIETKDDSLFFTNEKAPMSIGIEKGKNYYFLVITYARSGNDVSRSGLKVEEVSEREFFMTLLVNKHGSKPDEIFSY
jgi:hypothetical protein